MIFNKLKNQLEEFNIICKKYIIVIYIIIMEGIVNASEDFLIDSLSFRLSPTASYVTDRKSVSFFASGAQAYISGQGSRVLSIRLNGDGWLDPSTVRLVYTLRNKSGDAAKVLRPIGGPWSFFKRCRMLMGGSICDDIDNYNRNHEMLKILTSEASRNNDDIESWGNRWDSKLLYPETPGTKTVFNGSVRSFTGITSGDARTMSFKPLFGLLNQNKYIPLMFGSGLVMDFEIVGGAGDAIIVPTDTDVSAFPVATTSTEWQIEDCRIVADLCTLDSALQNSYAEHILSSKSLPINYSTYISTLQTCSGSNIAVNVTRAVSRLKTVFITLDVAPPAGVEAFSLVRKDWNSFCPPYAW